MLDRNKWSDFRVFLRHTWLKLGLPEPTPIQYKIADILQNIVKAGGIVPLPVSPTFAKRYPMLVTEDGKITKRVIIQAFRGVGKSWISAALTDWCLGFNVKLNIMSLSAAKQKSDEFTTFSLQLIQIIDELNFLMPDKSLGDRCSSLAFDVRGHGASQSPSVRSSGIFGMITGGRADLAFCDDIEVPKTSETQLLREKLLIRSVEVGGAIVKPETGVVVYLGTPQCEESLYDKLMKERGYKKIIIPARFPNDKWLNRFGANLEPSLLRSIQSDPTVQTGGGLAGDLGKPTDTRFTNDILNERQAEYGNSGFALQFMLDTSLSDAERYPLRLRDLCVLDFQDKVPASVLWNNDPDMLWKDLHNVGFAGDGFFRPLNLKVKNDIEYLQLTQSAMYIDPAGRGKDELAIAIGMPCNGLIWLKHVQGFLAGYEMKNLIAIANLAKKFKVQEIVTEPNFGDGMFDELLKPVLRDIYPCTVTPSEWSSQQKELRIIETLEPVMNSHLLVVDPSVIRSDSIIHDGEDPARSQQRQLFYQMTRITHEKKCLNFYDRLDAVAGLVNYFMKNLGIDQARTAKERDEDRMRAWLKDREFRAKKSMGIVIPRAPSWFGLNPFRKK